MSGIVQGISLGNQGPKISRLVYGVWRLNDDGHRQVDDVRRIVETCLELGISTFDHADIYGNYSCEETFGTLLKTDPSVRPKIQIITKCGCMPVSPKRPEHRIKHYESSSKHIEASVDRSLQLLNTDYLDVLLIHRPDPLMDPDDTAMGLQNVVKAGKVLHVGVSNFAPWQFELLQSRSVLPLVTNQIEAHVMTPAPFLDGTIGLCQKYGIPPMAWSPLAGGNLFSSQSEIAIQVREALKDIGQDFPLATMGQLALAWLLAHPSRIVPVIGSGDIQRIREQAESVLIKLQRQHWFRIWTAASGPVP